MDVTAVPLIDLGVNGCLSESYSLKDEEQSAVEVCSGLKQVRAVYLTNHGISQKQIKSAFDVSRRFFELPVSTKNKIQYQTDTKEGYSLFGQRVLSTDRAFECRESYDARVTSGVFPEQPEEFRNVIQTTMTKLLELSAVTLRLIAKGLGVPEDTFLKEHSVLLRGSSEIPESHAKTPQNGSVLRLAYYPPMEGPVEGKTRVGAHTDFGSISLLVHDEEEGLMIMNGNNEWLEVDPVPGAILVITGDIMEVWTGGELKATKHKVVAPSGNAKLRARYSMVMFNNLDDDVRVEPLLGDQHKYKPTSFKEHFYKKINDSYIEMK